LQLKDCRSRSRYQSYVHDLQHKKSAIIFLNKSRYKQLTNELF
jgi:hypothetical protein